MVISKLADNRPSVHQPRMIRVYVFPQTGTATSTSLIGHGNCFIMPLMLVWRSDALVFRLCLASAVCLVVNTTVSLST